MEENKQLQEVEKVENEVEEVKEEADEGEGGEEKPETRWREISSTSQLVLGEINFSSIFSWKN